MRRKYSNYLNDFCTTLQTERGAGCPNGWNG